MIVKKKKRYKKKSNNEDKSNIPLGNSLVELVSLVFFFGKWHVWQTKTISNDSWFGFQVHKTKYLAPCKAFKPQDFLLSKQVVCFLCKFNPGDLFKILKLATVDWFDYNGRFIKIT